MEENLSFKELLDMETNKQASILKIHTCKTTDQFLKELADEVEFDKNYYHKEEMTCEDINYQVYCEEQQELLESSPNYQSKIDLGQFFDISFFNFSDIASNFKVVWVIDPVTRKLYIRDTALRALKCFNADNGDGISFLEAMDCVITEITPVVLEVALIGDKQYVILNNETVEINLYCNEIIAKRNLAMII